MVSPSLALLMAAWIAEFEQATAPAVEDQRGSTSDASPVHKMIFFIVDLPSRSIDVPARTGTGRLHRSRNSLWISSTVNTLFISTV